MITLTFKEFAYSEDLIDFGTLDLELYVVRNKQNILYIGISKSGIYRRWFLEHSPHMFSDTLFGNTRIGIRIYNNLPNSAKWNMDLWSPTDVMEFLEIKYSWEEKDGKYRILDPITESFRLCDIKYLEELMIRYLVPKVNIMGNNWKEPNEYFLKKYLDTFNQER